MPTTQRLLTDTTGQALVTAVNNIVAAVKPNATEIQMSSSDTTTVATAITNINNKIGTVPSGQTVEEQITTLNSKIGNIGGLIARDTTSGSTMSGTLDLTNAHAVIAVINVHNIGDISMIVPLDGTQSVYGHIKYNDNYWASVKLQLTASNGQYTISFDAKGSSVSTFDYAYFYRL